MAIQNYTAIDELVKKHNEMKYGSGSVSKELDIPSPAIEVHELGEETEQDTVAEDIEEYVVPKSETIKLPPDLKKLGVQTTNDDEQFKAALYKLRLPISDDKIMEDLRASPSESKRWYATILMYILERSHLTLKKVGTKVVRMFKTN